MLEIYRELKQDKLQKEKELKSKGCPKSGVPEWDEEYEQTLCDLGILDSIIFQLEREGGKKAV